MGTIGYKKMDRGFVTNWLQKNGHSEDLSPIGYKKMDIQRICHQLVTKKWTFRGFVTNCYKKMDIQRICHQLVTKKWTFRGFVTNWLQKNGHHRIRTNHPLPK